MKLVLKINGESIKVNPRKLLHITDLDQDMNTVAADMAYWAAIHGAAEREKIQVDSYYRKWRADYGKSILDKNPKTSEWKVKQEIEAHGDFKKLKVAVSEAKRNCEITRGFCESIKVKANMLQSKGAMMRAQLDSTGMSTPSSDLKATNKKLKNKLKK